ncbi:MAG: hypothetical protein NTV04_20070 [Deltaproteobacteria bacterium]|nr:hypothetical protein [Deltaproteobacteria bacterium]
MKYREAWNLRKEKAIDIGTAWADCGVKDYPDPERSGVPRDKPRAFSKKKRRAAFLMVLHEVLSIREIARLAGVSEGLLFLWRTEKRFQGMSKKACKDFGIRIVNTISKEFIGEANKNLGIAENLERFNHGLEIPDLDYIYLHLIEVLPFYNIRTFEIALKLFTKRFREKPFYYVTLAPFLVKSISFYRDPADRSWVKNPILLESIKQQLGIFIRFLSDPAVRKVWTDEQLRKFGNSVQEMISLDLDFLTQ